MGLITTLANGKCWFRGKLKKNLEIIGGDKITPGLQIRCVKLTSTDSTCTCIISSQNPLFDNLLESSQWDNSKKWSNIFRNKNAHHIWSPDYVLENVFTIFCLSVFIVFYVFNKCTCIRLLNTGRMQKIAHNYPT